MRDSNKKKWRFLQKYWHKGAYFQDASDNAFVADKSDEIFGRDFSAPVGEDKLDKTVLPKASSACEQWARLYVALQGLTCSAAAGHAGEELRAQRADEVHPPGRPGAAQLGPTQLNVSPAASRAALHACMSLEVPATSVLLSLMVRAGHN